MSDYYRQPKDHELGPLFAAAAGRAAAAACTAKAEQVTAFDAARARAAVLELLADGQARSGEAIVDHCQRLGLVPHDARAFGAVFQKLKRAGQIEEAGFVARAKGHGTAGGRLWQITSASQRRADEVR
jgi:hypothetical protein